MAADRCPTGRELAAFSLGYLPDGEVEAIAGHLEACGACEAALVGLSAEPGRARAALGGEVGGSAGLFDELLEKYRPGRRVAGGATAIDPSGPTFGRADRTRVGGGAGGVPESAPRSPGRGGRRLGDYLLVREVGRGGMGVVYEAIQESLGRRVALKILGGDLKPDPRSLQRFRREAQSAARLHHTNIVAVYGVGEEGGSPYYVMQFIDGPGLDRVVQEMRRLRGGDADEPPTLAGDLSTRAATGPRSGTVGGLARTLLTGAAPPSEPATEAAGPGPDPVDLPGASSGLSASSPAWMTSAGGRGRDAWRAIAEIGAQVADALRHAHEHRTVHRDIKPSNILLDAEGTPWVADFGLAKAAEHEDVTRTGDIVGTIRYMAPERFRGTCDHRSDVYSLGLTLFELIALRPAFDEADRSDLIFQVTQGSPPRLRGLVPEVPRDLELIVHKAIERVPAHRYRTAGDLADDLRRFLDDRTIRARRVGPAGRLARWSRRNPWIAGLAASVFALLLAIAWGASWAAVEIAARAANLEQAGRDLDRSLYIARMNSAQLAGETASMPRLRDLLEPYLRPTSAGDLRGFEWYYWWRFSHTSFRSLIGQEGSILATAISADGRWIAAGGEDGAVRVWPMSGDSPPLVLGGHTSFVKCLGFSRDGLWLATAEDRAIHVWDLWTGRLIRTLDSPGSSYLASRIGVLDFSDSRSLVVIYRDNSTVRWDLETGAHAELVPGDTPVDDWEARGYTRPYALSADGRLFACGLTGGEVLVRRADGVGPPIRIAGPPSMPRSLAFAPPGPAGAPPRVAVGYEDRTIVVYDVGTGRPALGPLVGHTATPWSLAFSPSGDRLASGGLDNLLILWNSETGETRETLRGHSNSIQAVAFSPDGLTLASASSDALVNLWDVSAPSPRDVLLGHTAAVDALSYSADGTLVFSGGRDNDVRIWRAGTGESLGLFGGPGRHTAQVRALACTPDGKFVISAGWDNRIKFWDIARRELAFDFAGTTARTSTAIYSLTLSPDGGTLAYAGDNLSVTLWDVASRSTRLRISTGHDSPALAFSPDGKFLATAEMSSRSVRLWDARDGRPSGPPLETRARGAESLLFAPDGKHLAAGHRDGTISVWEMPSRRPLRAMAMHSNSVTALAFSPDGRSLASGGRDNMIKLWDVASGELKTTLRGHASNVLELAFSPDGQTLASGSIDRTVRLWRSADPRDVPAPPASAEAPRRAPRAPSDTRP